MVNIRGSSTRLAQALRRFLYLIARPARRDRGRGGLVIQSYRGYGSSEAIFLAGRVFRQPGYGASVRGVSLRRDLIDLGRRILRHGVAHAALIARLEASEHLVTTDRDGYFRVRMPLIRPPSSDRLWHSVELKLLSPAGPATKAEVFVPPRASRFVVISDIDDTVMYTGVASKTRMLWRLFMEGAQSRVAFPGAGALYRALHQGAGGDEFNPLLYVSRAPWSNYEVLDEFFKRHDIPVGPILFLREWGLTLQRPLPRRTKGHKLALIREMLSLYHTMPFVLMGDSGQRDPEIYTQVVREQPGRVLAVYIRNVSPDLKRQQAIESLAEQVARVGSSLLLAADSVAMTEHALAHGLIAPEAVATVRKERQEQGESALQPTRTLKRSTPHATREAVVQGGLKQALGTNEISPPNVVIEPEEGPSPEPSSRRDSEDAR